MRHRPARHHDGAGLIQSDELVTLSNGEDTSPNLGHTSIPATFLGVTVDR